MTARGTSADRWSLTDRRDFLRRSLDDADREHEAGDLDDADFELLRRRDLAALAAVEAELEELEPAGHESEDEGAVRPDRRDRRDGRDRPDGGDRPDRGRGTGRRRRVWLAVAGAAAVVAGATVLVTSLATSRQPGQVATGSIKTSEAQQIERDLAQAATLVGEHQDVQALRTYESVLAKVPHQRTALAESGWLEWESGTQSKNRALEARGRAAVAEAVRVAPGFYAARAYLGTIEVDGGDAAAAVAQYRKFLSDHPPPRWVRAYAPEIRTAFTHAGQPVPTGVPPASG